MYSKSVEDYLEAIYNIISKKGYVRTKNIAGELNVTPPSVSAMLKKLEAENLILYEKYGGIILSDKGEKIAKSIKHKHDTLTKILKLMLVPDNVAEIDACKLEHNLSFESINQLATFVEFIENKPIYRELLYDFKTFCETK
jgi:DtxR family Mn-dependent transcriptional regulator